MPAWGPSFFTEQPEEVGGWAREARRRPWHRGDPVSVSPVSSPSAPVCRLQVARGDGTNGDDPAAPKRWPNRRGAGQKMGRYRCRSQLVTVWWYSRHSSRLHSR